MAGSQNADDNPVAINVVPMVDVIFCLCVFFMCSCHFKAIEAKLENWLPKDHGGSDRGPAPVEVRVAVFWDEAGGRTRRLFGHRSVDDDAGLEQLLRDAHDDAMRLSRPREPLLVDADPRVPWSAVVTVENLGSRAGFTQLEFAQRR